MNKQCNNIPSLFTFFFRVDQWLYRSHQLWDHQTAEAAQILLLRPRSGWLSPDHVLVVLWSLACVLRHWPGRQGEIDRLFKYLLLKGHRSLENPSWIKNSHDPCCCNHIRWQCDHAGRLNCDHNIEWSFIEEAELTTNQQWCRKTIREDCTR